MFKCLTDSIEKKKEVKMHKIITIQMIVVFTESTSDGWA